METKKNSGRYCIAYGCLNKTKLISNLSLFRLPQDPDRRYKWLKAIGREDLLKLENLKTKNYEVCIAHFDESNIKSYNLLKNTAMPTKTPVKIYEPISDSQIEPNIPKNKTIACQTETEKGTDAEAQTGECAFVLKRKASQCEEDTKCKRSRLEDDTDPTVTVKMEPNEELTDTPTAEDSLDEIKEEIPWLDVQENVERKIQNLIDFQNEFKNRPTEYSEFALNLLLASPEAYRCFQSVLKLPNKPAEKKYKLIVPPTIDDKLLKNVALRIKSLPVKAKHCVVCVKQMPLKPRLVYNAKKDDIHGFHNINGVKSTEPARHAYVIMLQSLYSDWSHPVAYALLASSKNFDELDLWISEVITKLFDHGIEVRALVTPPDSNFDEYATTEKNVTTEHPYFFVDGRKIYYIFDLPDLVTNLQNHLFTKIYLDNSIISWDYIQRMFYASADYKLVPKLNVFHIEKSSEKRSYALETFSNSTAAAIEMCIELNMLPEEARTTAKFVKTINDLIDVLNSSKSKSMRSAFRMSEKQVKILQDAQDMFFLIQSVNKYSTRTRYVNEMKALDNFQVTIESVKQLFEDLREEGFSYLFTRRLTQDNMADFFDSIKGQIPCLDDTDPSALQFARAYSKSLIRKLVNVAPVIDSDVHEMLQVVESEIETFKSNPEPKFPESQVRLPGENDFRFQRLTLPLVNALAYVASYLSYKCNEKHKCQEMAKKMESLPDLNNCDELYPRFKDYNKTASFYGLLKVPPKEIIDYVNRLENALVEYFVKYVHDQPGSSINEILLGVPVATLCPCFPSEYFVKVYIRLRISSLLKFNNAGFKNVRTNRQFIVRSLSI